MKQSKQQYYELLREKWKYAKALADNDQTAKALYVEMGGKVSYYSFYFTLRQMKDQKLKGIPYIDAKTFNGWKQVGFRVMKGQRSTLQGITWVESKKKEEEEEDGKKKRKFIYPKIYHLFHRTQVEEVKIK